MEMATATTELAAVSAAPSAALQQNSTPIPGPVDVETGEVAVAELISTPPSNEKNSCTVLLNELDVPSAVKSHACEAEMAAISTEQEAKTSTGGDVTSDSTVKSGSGEVADKASNCDSQLHDASLSSEVAAQRTSARLEDESRTATAVAAADIGVCDKPLPDQLATNVKTEGNQVEDPVVEKLMRRMLWESQRQCEQRRAFLWKVIKDQRHHGNGCVNVEELEHLSALYFNVKYLQCTYDRRVLDKLKRYESDICAAHQRQNGSQNASFAAGDLITG